MKRLIIILATAMVAVGAMAQYSSIRTSADVKADMRNYQYAYIIPTGAITSSSGVAGVIGHGVFGNAVATTNPADIISGFLIKKGFSILPSPVPELAEQTIIVSFGYSGTSRRENNIVIQLSDGVSHKLLATYESVCPYFANDSRAIDEALYAVLPLIGYSLRPKLFVAQKHVGKSNIKLFIGNYTPNPIHRVDIKATYSADGQVIHEQIVSIPVKLRPGDEVEKSFKRDKQVQSKDIHVKMVVDSYQ